MKAWACNISACWLMLSAFFLLPFSIDAQQQITKVYNVADGLPGTETEAIYQDRYGYLWIPSSAGMSRFDGRQFVNYSLSDGLPTLNCLNIFQDSRERLWIGTAAGMAEFKNNRFITFRTSDNSDIAYTFGFAETKQKKLWAFTDKGVYEFQDSVWKKIVLFPGYDAYACRGMGELNGELYLNYTSDIVYRDSKGNWQHLASEKDYSSIFNVLSIQQGEIWVSTSTHIYAIRHHQMVPVYESGQPNFFTYFLNSRKELLIGEHDNLKVSSRGDFNHFTIQPLREFTNAVIFEDSSHNLWLNSIEGLIRQKEMFFSIIDKTTYGPLDGIYNMAALPDNRTLLSSGTRMGMLVYGNNTWEQIPPPDPARKADYYRDPVDGIAIDGNNNTWIITRFKRFLNFNGHNLIDFSKALHLTTTENIYDFAYIKNRKQFFLCADSTLLYGDSLQFKTFIPKNTGVQIIKPTRVHMVQNGLVLLYIDGKGVYGIDTLNNVFPLLKETKIDGSRKGIQLGVIFYEDKMNNFWISVPGFGLYEYGFSENSRPYLKNHISLEEGLQGNIVFNMAMDRQYRLWVATNTGLDILQLKKSGVWEVFNFAKEEELSINNSVYEKLFEDRQGYIWLSSLSKIIKFNPAAVTLHKETPHIIIEKVSLDFRETDWSTLSDSLYSYFQLPYHPVLKYNQNSLEIAFNAVDLSASGNNIQYSYKLLPIDTTWTIPSRIKSVSFEQLPPGKYEFMVKAKNGSSEWSKPASFRFKIKQPFWTMWWFRILVIIIFSAFIFRLFSSRIKKIKERAAIQNQLKELEMKALKAQMNPHFIFNALNSIQALLVSDKNMEGIHYLGSFSRLLRQVLDNSDNNIISLDKELETIGLYIQLEALRLDMQLKYKKEVPTDIVAEFEKLPPLILQPFIENALWHGLSRKEGEKEIIISISVSEGWLVCDISDNGIGRVKAGEWKSLSSGLQQSKGIDITRKRLIEYNEEASVIPVEFYDLYENNNPSGTRVTVRIKRKLR